MGVRQRGRSVSVSSDGELLEEWYTVETSEGVAVGGLDAVFDFETEAIAIDVLKNVVAEVGKPLSVVGYTRSVLGTYAAVTKVEKVD